MKYIVTILSILCSTIGIQAQTWKSEHTHRLNLLSDNKKTAYLHQALNTSDQIEEKYFLWYQLAINYIAINQIDQGIKLISNRITISSIPDEWLRKYKRILIFLYFQNGEIDFAIKSVINYFQEFQTNDIQLKYLQSKLYNLKGENELALHILDGLESKHIFRTEIYKSDIYSAMGKYDTVDQILRSIPYTTKAQQKSILFRLGNNALIHEHFNKAGNAYNNWLDLSTSTSVYDIMNKGRIYTNLMQVYGKQNKDSILFVLDSAYFYKTKIHGPILHIAKSGINQNMAEWHLLNDRFKQANIEIDSAILHHLSSINIEQLPTDPFDFNLIPDKLNLLEFLNIKVSILQHIDPTTAIQAYYTIDMLIEAIKQESFTESGQLHHQEKLSKYYKQAFRYCLRQHALEDALYFSQKTKNTLLFEQVMNNKENTFMPKTQFSKLQVLSKQKYKAFQQLDETNNKDSLIQLLSQYSLDMKSILDSIAQINPSYLNWRYNQKVVSVQDIQKDLDATSVLLDFSFHEDSIFTIIISKDFFMTHRNALSQSFHEKLKEVSNTLKQVPKPSKWNSNSQLQLFDHLDAIAQHLLDKSVYHYSTWYIVLDGSLHHIPIECMRHNNQFIIQNHSIGYLPNLAFWKSHQPQKKRKLKQLTLVKPNYKHAHLQLPHLNREIEQISKTMPTLITESNRIPENTDALHYLAHASEEPDFNNSYILLSDTFKYTFSDILMSNNQYQHVCISVCQSNTGPYISGEGNISLSRAFIQSGTDAVISSNWQVDDYSTARIIGSYYQYLSQGLTKSESLQKSKHDYLHVASLYQQHPYFWAPFVLLGDDAPFVQQNNPKMIIAIVSCIILGLFILYIFTNSKFNKISKFPNIK